MNDNAPQSLRDTAYRAHYELFEHYSSLILRVRITIATVSLLVFGYAFGFLQNAAVVSANLLGISDRGAVAILGALSLCLFFLMEVGYIQRIYQVIAAGRALEGDDHLPSYFRHFGQSASWPIHSFYTLSILLLSVVFLRLSLASQQSCFGGVFVILVSLTPAAGVVTCYIRCYSVRKLLPSGM